MIIQNIYDNILTDLIPRFASQESSCKIRVTTKIRYLKFTQILDIYTIIYTWV